MIYEANIPTNERTAFIEKVRVISAKYGFRADWLMIVMGYETGYKFNTGNHGNGATGLIGFRASTATTLGTTQAALSAMSRLEQLTYVDKYLSFWNAGSKVTTLTDLYMIVYSPANAGKPANTVLSRAGSQAYELNKGLDRDKKGYITIADAAFVVNQIAAKSGIPTGSATPITLFWLVIVSVFAVAFYTFRKQLK